MTDSPIVRGEVPSAGARVTLADPWIVALADAQALADALGAARPEAEGEAVPPTLVAAVALRLLTTWVTSPDGTLPPGRTIHVAHEHTCTAPVRIGDALRIELTVRSTAPRPAPAGSAARQDVIDIDVYPTTARDSDDGAAAEEPLHRVTETLLTTITDGAAPTREVPPSPGPSMGEVHPREDGDGTPTTGAFPRWTDASSGYLAAESPVGTELAARTVRLVPNDLQRYAEASGDTNPIHLDPAAAAELGFPGVIAQGMALYGLAIERVRAALPEGSATGVDSDVVGMSCRFVRPLVVPAVGADVSFRATLKDRVVEDAGTTLTVQVMAEGEGRRLFGKAEVRVLLTV